MTGREGEREKGGKVAREEGREGVRKKGVVKGKLNIEGQNVREA